MSAEKDMSGELETVPEKLTVLLTNDDGYKAPGLTELASLCHWDKRVDLWVIVPYHNQTGQSQAISLQRDIAIAKKSSEAGLQTIVVDGTPADCVYLGVQKLMPRRPDIIISGINHGANFGCDIHYSGTVGAAREGAIYSIPSIALSHDANFSPDFPYDDLAWLAHYLIFQENLWKELGRHSFLNINIPKNIDFNYNGKEKIYKHASLARSRWGGDISLRTVKGNENSLVARLGNERIIAEGGYPTSDYEVVREQGKVSITVLGV